MNYSIDYSLSNGLGKPAVSLFLYGCDKPGKCSGCHNVEIQMPAVGDRDKLVDKVLKALNNGMYFTNNVCLAILGGEPLASWNVEDTLRVCTGVRKFYPHIKIILYSWRSVDEIDKNFKEIANVVDYGVLGAFDIETRDICKIPSSSNQVIYDFRNKQNIPAVDLYRGGNSAI